MARQKPDLPKGFRDFLPAVMVPRKRVMDTLTRTFERYGFEPLETPAMERIETLTGKYGEEGEQLMFKVLRRGEKAGAGEVDLAMRYDLTVPLSRVVAMYPDLPRPFRRYQIQPVWRADRPQKGRYREFTQCDVDVVGSTSPLVEVEVITMMDGVFRELGFGDHVVRVNHRQVLNGLVRSAGVPDDLQVSTIVAIDKLDKVGKDGVAKELGERGVSEGSITRLLQLLDLAGPWRELLPLLSTLVGEDAGAAAGVANLKSIFTGLEAAGVPDRHVALDPFLARGLSYYTGAVFETRVADVSFSLGGGGRYDELIGMFLGENVPACGISFGFDRMITVMEDRGMFTNQRSAVQVLVTVYNDDLQNDAIALASLLRTAGITVDLYPGAVKLGNQLRYAERRGIPLAVLMGPDEVNRGEVTLKNLTTRAQEAVSRHEVVAAIRRHLPYEE